MPKVNGNDGPQGRPSSRAQRCTQILQQILAGARRTGLSEEELLRGAQEHGCAAPDTTVLRALSDAVSSGLILATGAPQKPSKYRLASKPFPAAVIDSKPQSNVSPLNQNNPSDLLVRNKVIDILKRRIEEGQKRGLSATTFQKRLLAAGIQSTDEQIGQVLANEVFNGNLQEGKNRRPSGTPTTIYQYVRDPANLEEKGGLRVESTSQQRCKKRKRHPCSDERHVQIVPSRTKPTLRGGETTDSVLDSDATVSPPESPERKPGCSGSLSPSSPTMLSDSPLGPSPPASLKEVTPEVASAIRLAVAVALCETKPSECDVRLHATEASLHLALGRLQLQETELKRAQSILMPGSHNTDKGRSFVVEPGSVVWKMELLEAVVSRLETLSKTPLEAKSEETKERWDLVVKALGVLQAVAPYRKMEPLADRCWKLGQRLTEAVPSELEGFPEAVHHAFANLLDDVVEVESQKDFGPMAAVGDWLLKVCGMDTILSFCCPLRSPCFPRKPAASFYGPHAVMYHGKGLLSAPLGLDGVFFPAVITAYARTLERMGRCDSKGVCHLNPLHYDHLFYLLDALQSRLQSLAAVPSALTEFQRACLLVAVRLSKLCQRSRPPIDSLLHPNDAETAQAQNCLQVLGGDAPTWLGAYPLARAFIINVVALLAVPFA